MAAKFKLSSLFGGKKKNANTPATKIDLGSTGNYDPLATVAIMENLRREMKSGPAPSRLPLIGGMKLAQQTKVLIAIGVLLLIIGSLLIALGTRQAALVSASAEHATELQMLSQRLARGVSLTALGNPAGFTQIEQSRDRFRAILTGLLGSGKVADRDVAVVKNAETQPILDDIKTRWDKVEANATLILTNKASLTSLASGVDNINKGNAPILELSEQAAAQLAQAGGNVREVAIANQLVMLTQRIAKNANALVSTDDIDPEVAFLLGKDVGSFRDYVAGLVKGSEALRLAGVKDPEAKASFTELQKKFGDYEGRVNAILQNMQKLVSAKQAARNINQEAEPLLEKTKDLTRAYTDTTGSMFITYGGALIALLGLICFGFVVKLYVDDARFRRSESEQENKRNQEAILRLLNEMGSLADGDLTVQASVTEDVTGAIADSINYTIDELRSLVKGINRATEQVTRATQDAQAISNRLFESSQQQSREIQQASASVLQMAQSINEVSMSAAQSAKVAQQSLSAAEKGQTAVENQIAGMNEIRDQIQETAKRIKRLGESSLEIGEIVELISDITEQTNVLALNAAIQAASAGEAGRGFTVVAEEVQRLAERSGEATKQIEAIVKTIQADTQDAVAAMEKSTSGVVAGTKLSDAAGQALQEIRHVSRELAELIQSISQQTQRQSASVTEVTRGMQDILKITEETTEGTKQTNVSIAQLNQLANELRASVAGFKV